MQLCKPYGAASPPVVFGALAALLLLAPDLSEFGVPGLLTLRKRVESVEESSEGAVLRAEDAQAASAGAVRRAEVAETARLDGIGAAPTEARTTAAVLAEVDELADRYDDIRATQPAGAPRTAAMTRVVTRMTEILADAPGFDVAGHLASSDRGERLAGCAALYARPEPALLPLLVDTLEREDKPFGQYWALRAIEQTLARDPTALTDGLRAQLRAYGKQVPRDTDRAYELSQILADDA